MKRLLTITALLCALASPLAAQVPVALSPVPAQQFFSNAGAPLASGCIYTYITGTSTPLATYTDGTGTAQNTNPVILNAGGFANLWLSNSSYRFSIWSYGSGAVGANCGNGSFQRTVDQVSAYTIINTPQNLFLLGASSDPAGSAGELAYRTDIPCFRGFTTLWDCFVTLTGIQSLTNKTFVSPTITGTVGGSATYTSPTFTSPNVNGVVVVNGPATYTTLSNDAATGTTINTLTKMNGGLSIIASAGDTGGVVGITVSGAGKTGLATVQQNGAVNQCVFDNGSVAGDYIQISATVAGNCHDAGATYPTSGQVIGRAILTAGGAGTYAMMLFGPEITAVQAIPKTVYNTSPAPSTTSIPAIPMVTPAANLTYRFSVYMDQTALGVACAGSTTVTPALQFQDPNGAAPVSTAWATAFTIVNNGALGTNTNSTATTSIWTTVFRAKSGVSIQYSTTFVAAGGCAPPPSVQVFPILEQITAN